MESINIFKKLISDEAKEYSAANLKKWTPIISKTYRPAVLEKIKDNVNFPGSVYFLYIVDDNFKY
jgi:hypothetical protein